MKTQSDYTTLTPSIEPIKKGDIKLGDLITNNVTKCVWAAEQYDVDTMCGDTYTEHRKFRKMIPLN